MKLQLGAISRPLDVRDIKLGEIQAPILIPEKFLPDLTKYPKYFQGPTPSCGAHAGTALKTIQETNEMGYPVNLSPRYLWTKIKQIDGLGYQWGTDMRSIFKCLQKNGICHFDLGGNNVYISLQHYANMLITGQMEEDAKPRVINSYGFLPSGFSLEDLKQAIYQNKAVILLIRCDDGFFRTTEPTFTEEKYGHYVVAGGYYENGIYIIDSTEEDFSLSVKCIQNKYFSFIKEAGTAIDADTNLIDSLIDEKRLLQKVIEALKLNNANGVLDKLINTLTQIKSLWTN